MSAVPRSGLIAFLALLATAGSAQAGKPGTWTAMLQPLSANTNDYEVGMARLPDGTLDVLWSSDKQVHSTRLGADGVSSPGGGGLVFTYPNVVNPSVALTRDGSNLRAFFTSLFPNDPLDGVMATATSADGTTWSAPAPASDNRVSSHSAVYAGEGISGIVVKGVPISVWGESAPGQAGYHVGLNPSDPDVHFANATTATAGNPNVAADAVTGDVAIAWNDLDAGRTLVRSLSPPGGPLPTPGGRAPDALERVALTGRLSGKDGIYVGYLKGRNPFSSVPEAWRIGAPESVTIANMSGARFIGLAPAQSGRIWGFWYVQSPKMLIYAARSNRKVTKFGLANKLPLPSASFTAVYSLEGEGSAPGGQLDLLALMERTSSGGAKSLAYWHQRVLPRLGLGVSVKNGSVVLTVTDAGEYVDGATVNYAGHSGMTANGKVTFPAEDGKHKATAQKTGYTGVQRNVTV